MWLFGIIPHSVTIVGGTITNASAIDDFIPISIAYKEPEIKKKNESFKRVVDKRDPKYINKRKEYWPKHLN